VGSPGLEPVDNPLMTQLRLEGFLYALPARSLLFAEGEAPRGVHMLCKGHVKLTINSTEGKTFILKISEPGDILGLHNCVSGDPYEMTATTIQPCQVSFIKREDFLRFLHQHSDACLQTALQLSKTCHMAYDTIRSLGLSHSVSEKLARLLLELSADADARDGVRIELGLTHEEIAQMIGTSRETVTRLLADFRKKQIASLKGSTLFIQNRAGLEKLVGILRPCTSESRGSAMFALKRPPASVDAPSPLRNHVLQSQSAHRHN